MRARLGALVGVAALAAVLGGCGDGDTAEQPTPPEDLAPITQGESPTAQTATPEGTADAGPTAAGLPAEYDGVLAAVDRAVADQGGQAFEVDDDDGGTWEVHLAVGAEEVEVRVSADGGQILSTDREGALDATDRAGLDAAGDFTLAQALRTAIAEYGGTTAVEEVTISDDDGAFAWEVTFADDVEVYLDIATGALLRVETD